MRTKELPGLAGLLVTEYFCKLSGPVDEGLAVGGALDALRWAVGNRCSVQPPSVTPLWTNADIPKVVTWAPTVLVGPGGAIVVEATEALLGLADTKPPTPQPWPQWGPLPEARRCCLGTWNEPFLSPLYHGDYFLLVPADGHIATGAGADAALLVARLRAVTASAAEFFVRMDAVAAEAYRAIVRQWARECVEACDYTPMNGRIRRWTHVAALLAVGVNQQQPVITYGELAAAHEIAFVRHEAAWSALEALGAGVPVH